MTSEGWGWKTGKGGGPGWGGGDQAGYCFRSRADAVKGILDISAAVEGFSLVHTAPNQNAKRVLAIRFKVFRSFQSVQ